MTNQPFWQWFDAEAAPRLALREVSFRKIFQYLDALQDRITIVETGCARMADNWAGDGQSTVLFDRYAASRSDSMVVTIDLDPEATRICKTLVSDRVTVHTGDSVAVLPQISRRLKIMERSIDLLYLDSYDLDWGNPVPSAVHHLKELVSIISMVNPRTLVVIDDSAMIGRMVADAQGRLNFLAEPVPGGKSTYVAEYAAQVHAKLLFSHYQIGWTNLVAVNPEF
jgi:hypothetical protein